MDGWLKENKAYVITVGSMILGVVLIYMLVLNPISSDSDKLSQQLSMQANLYRSKSQQGVPDDGALADAKRERDSEKASLKAEVERLQLRLDEKKFLSKGSDGYRERFEEIKLSIRDHLRDRNGKQGLLEFPSGLGWSNVSIETQEEGKAALLRLGVGQGVMEAVISSLGKGEKITSVNFFQDWDRGEEEEGAFLSRVPVQVVITASSKSIFQLIHLFQKPGTYYCLESLKVQRASTSGEDSFNVSLVVSGLIIEEAAPPPFESSEEDFE